MKKSVVVWILLIFSILFSLSSCTRDVPQSTEPQKKTLWIVTEPQDIAECTDDMDWQIREVISDFKLAHKDVTVTLEILPSEKDKPEERSVRLEQLRTEILAGKGPDVYLMPIAPLTGSPLFKDVQQAMRNGVFYDISSYYNADDALGKEELVAEVMDGGVVDGGRYVLPISYNYAALFTDRSVMEPAGLDLEAAASDVYSLYRALSSTGDPQWYCSLHPLPSRSYSHFMPQMIDYASGNVLIDEAQMENFLKLICSDWSQYSMPPHLDWSGYIQYGAVFSQQEPAMMHMITQAIPIAAISKVAGQELVAIPVRATDGDLVASITYYGAVGNGSADPELAYEFLREFLLEDVQLQRDRMKRKRISLQTYFTYGIPVRSKGKAAELWENEKIINKSWLAEDKEAKERKSALLAFDMTQEDVPILDVTIDRVHFANYFDREIMYYALNKLYENPENTKQIAEDLIFQLQVHAAEG